MSDEFQQIVRNIEENIRDAIKEFTEWTIENWQMNDKDRNDEYFKDKTPDWIEGYNAAIKSLSGAQDVFLEENLQ